MKSVTRRANRRTAADDKGFVAIEFVAGVGLLLLPIALLVMSFPTWAERQSMARVAAREAARTFALTADAGAAAAVVNEIEGNYGLPDDNITVTLSDFPVIPIQTGDVVTATVSIKVPALNLGLMDIANAEFTITEEHSEPVDLYRSRTAP